MATTGIRLPTSNPGGNNQTSPGAGIGIHNAVPVVSGAGGLPGTPNPYFTPPAGSGTGTGSLYDTISHYPGGQTDINKQLIDLYGKGVGGSLDNLLKNMSGASSATFQQFLASMDPTWAAQRANLDTSLSAGGVSANSSVAALGEASLGAQQSAQAAGVNADLMHQQLQDTLAILMGTKDAAAKETATSGWTVFRDVMNNITGDIGNLAGGSYNSSAPQVPSMSGATTPGVLPNFGPAVGDTTNYNDPSWAGLGSASTPTDFSQLFQ